MKLSAADPSFYTGSVWLMASGSWQVRFDITGPSGNRSHLRPRPRHPHLHPPDGPHPRHHPRHPRPLPGPQHGRSRRRRRPRSPPPTRPATRPHPPSPRHLRHGRQPRLHGPLRLRRSQMVERRSRRLRRKHLQPLEITPILTGNHLDLRIESQQTNDPRNNR